jgi:hypothetical protein
MSVKIREKPKDSGVWWVFIDHHGRRKSKMIGRDKKLAREVAEKISAKLTLVISVLSVKKRTSQPLRNLQNSGWSYT